ncbi:MAG TPA: potassium-transporting ATPase subunit B, partial [Mycobacterium sp.]|nr:potassium-transporting ATPase subunit B [Mycobacterium sp.]
MSVTTIDATVRKHSAPKSSSKIQGGLLDPKMLWKSLPDALRKLDPRTLWHNPVMFIVEIGSVFTTVLAITDPSVFAWVTTVWLWLTVVFANLAEAVAEGRGKAQADTLRKTRAETVARRRVAKGIEDSLLEEVPSTALDLGDEVVVTAGEVIPS